MLKLTTGACSKYCSNETKSKVKHYVYIDPLQVESIEDISGTKNKDFGFNSKIVTKTGHEHYVCEPTNIVLGQFVAEQKKREKENGTID
jgi:hypothetical protein